MERERKRDRLEHEVEKKEEDCGPVSPLSNKLLSIRRPATKHTAVKNHRNTHTQSNYSQGGHQGHFIGGWEEEEEEEVEGRVQLQSFSPSKRTHGLLFCFQLFFTNKNQAGGEKNLD